MIDVKAVGSADITNSLRARLTGDLAAKVEAIWGEPAEGMPWVDVVIS